MNITKEKVREVLAGAATRQLTENGMKTVITFDAQADAIMELLKSETKNTECDQEKAQVPAGVTIDPILFTKYVIKEGYYYHNGVTCFYRVNRYTPKDVPIEYIEDKDLIEKYLKETNQP